MGCGLSFTGFRLLSGLGLWFRFYRVYTIVTGLLDKIVESLSITLHGLKTLDTLKNQES